MSLISRTFKYYFKYYELWRYNKKHKTKIFSRQASIKASYGKEVLIGKNTVVTADVTIGDYSYVNTGSYIENCIIGKFCSISSGVYICPYEHNHQMRTTHPVVRWGVKEPPRPQVNIGNDVLISLNAIILEGITIGDGAVIGAGAIVTRDVAPYEIVGGIPARHIKWRFEEKEKRLLQELQWWNWDINKIINNIEFLRNNTNNLDSV